MAKKGHTPWNKGKKQSEEIKKRISETLKRRYKEGLQIGFRKGHLCYSYNLKEWNKTHPPWNKGLSRYLQPNWRGGITDFNSQVRKLSQYIEWRNKVFGRDKYTCQMCNSRSGLGITVKFHAYHIDSLAKILFENGISTIQQAISCAELWDIKNGRTLCDNCHGKTDNYLWKGLMVSVKGRQKTTLRQRSKGK